MDTNNRPLGTVSRGETPAAVRALGWTSFLTDFSSEAIYPLLPGFVKGLGGTSVEIGLIDGIANAVAAVVRLPSGAISDAVGRCGVATADTGRRLACIRRHRRPGVGRLWPARSGHAAPVNAQPIGSTCQPARRPAAMSSSGSSPTSTSSSGLRPSRCSTVRKNSTAGFRQPSSEEAKT